MIKVRFVQKVVLKQSWTERWRRDREGQRVVKAEVWSLVLVVVAKWGKRDRDRKVFSH